VNADAILTAMLDGADYLGEHTFDTGTDNLCSRERRAFLLVSVPPNVFETLCHYAAEREDMEPNGDDEPDHDTEGGVTVAA
jgi:hypothetical protein